MTDAQESVINRIVGNREERGLYAGNLSLPNQIAGMSLLCTDGPEFPGRESDACDAENDDVMAPTNTATANRKTMVLRLNSVVRLMLIAEEFSAGGCVSIDPHSDRLETVLI